MEKKYCIRCGMFIHFWVRADKYKKKAKFCSKYCGGKYAFEKGILNATMFKRKK